MAKISDNIARNMGLAKSVVAITKSDSTVYDPPLDGFWVGGTGDVAVIAESDSAAVTIESIPAGTFIGVRCTKIMSTNTDATAIVGFRNV